MGKSTISKAIFHSKLYVYQRVFVPLSSHATLAELPRVLGHLSAGNAHGNADVRLLQGRRIVHTITRHGGDLVQGL